jgi:hypothetical protein
MLGWDDMNVGEEKRRENDEHLHCTRLEFSFSLLLASCLSVHELKYTLVTDGIVKCM